LNVVKYCFAALFERADPQSTCRSNPIYCKVDPARERSLMFVGDVENRPWCIYSNGMLPS